MTTNLNLAGGTALSSTDTDVSSDYINNFSTSNNLTKSSNTIVLPASTDTGAEASNYAYVSNSNNTDCGSGSPCYSYYSWDAATLGSGRSVSTENTDAPYSICPKGWVLPTTGNVSNGEWKRGDLYRLIAAYGINLENNYRDGSDMFDRLGPNTIANFQLAGAYFGGHFSSKDLADNTGPEGYYWSRTSLSGTTYARSLRFGSLEMNLASYYNRVQRFSVRCLFGG